MAHAGDDDERESVLTEKEIVVSGSYTHGPGERGRCGVKRLLVPKPVPPGAFGRSKEAITSRSTSRSRRCPSVESSGASALET